MPPPQALRFVVPPVGNYFVLLFKDTALVSTISIAELRFRGQLIAADTFKHMRIDTVISAIHLAIIVRASLIVRRLQRRFDPRRKLQNRSP